MSLKILHTADWHIGKKLYDYSLVEDHKLFFNDLIAIITENKIDYLLISGDVFDLSHPSHESLELYYLFITQLIPTGCRLIITGGNHDSPGVLNAPKDILNLLHVKVVGCATENPGDELIPLLNGKNEIVAVTAAVPYLRDRDIRVFSESVSTDQRIEAIRNGIQKHYQKLSDLCASEFPGIPAIAMGHLYAQNSALSDSEREIQIGNLAGINEKTFPDNFQYVALGHIHKPQKVGETSRIRYSGSPFALSFSEKNYRHQVILLEVNNGEITQKEIFLPKHRSLMMLEGTLEEIHEILSNFKNDYDLTALLEIRITEKNYDPLILRSRDLLSEELKKKNAQIIQYRVNFQNENAAEPGPSKEEENISDLHPAVLWESLINDYPAEKQQELRAAFLEIIESSNEEQES